MDMKQKRLPIGIESFCEIRKEKFYYVDKTGLIKELLNNWGKVNLFTRPRRFGKSLNMNMLQSFFEIDADRLLFEQLEIASDKELCEEYMGQYPVISISLKDVDGTDYQSAYRSLCIVISNETKRIVEKSKLLESEKLTDYDLPILKNILNRQFEDEADLTSSIQTISALLHQHYGRKVIVLIDEYDVPLDKANQNNYYEQMLGTIRLLLSKTLKSNEYMYFAVLTGCLRIAKESIFTGLNNFKVRSVSDIEFAGYFGFTDKEVKEILSYYDLEEFYDIVKEWYDGYHFGLEDIYCPWDVINYCDKLLISKDSEPEPYWVNSSSNTIIQNILTDASETTKSQIEALISGEAVEKKIVPELTYKDLDSEDLNTRETYLWSVLLATGYLTELGGRENGISKLVIPNREIHEIYTEKIRSWYNVTVKRNTRRWQEFCDAVKAGKAELFQQILNQYMSESISIRDTFSKKEMKENFYHGMLLGILQCEGNWIVKSNQESGIGYSDILLLAPSEKTGCVIEVKYAENGAFEKSLREAMRQIDEKGYADLLKREGMNTIHLYGVACYKKCCQIVYKELKP